jgi:PAS domain S-box-containing protein
VSGQNGHVLIISGSGGFRAELRQLLARGAEGPLAATEADTAAAALGRLRVGDEAPDCIILAHEPPELDALEVLAALRAGQAVPPWPVVILSTGAAEGRGLERAALRAGAMELVERGALNARTLRHALENALDRFASSRPAAGARAPATDEGSPASSRAQLDAVLDAMADGLVVFDMAGNVVLLNEAEARICGFANAAEMKRDLAFFANIYELTLDGRPLPVEQWPVSRVLRGESLADWRLGARRLDTGQEWHISFSGAPVRDEAGRQLLAVVITRDITQQVRAEQALRASQMRYRTLFESIDEGFCIIQMLFDEHGHPIDYRFVETNAAFEAQTGLKDALGKTARELIPQLDESWFIRYGRVAITGEAVRFENHAPAMHRWFEVFASRVGDPERREVAVVFKNITQRKEAEQALRESEARAHQAAAKAEAESRLLDAVLEAAPAGIIVADASGQLLRMNPANERLWGIAPWSRSVDEYGEWKGWWADGSERHGRRIQAQEWAMTRALRGEVATGEVVAIEPFDAPGARRIMINSGAPVRDAAGRILGGVIAQMDITARVEAEAQLKEALRARDEFLSVASHELRTPLTSIKLQLQMMERRIQRGDETALTPEQVGKLLALTNRQIERLAQLVNDMLDIARIRTDRLVIRLVPVDAVELVRDVLERLETNLVQAGTPATLEAPPRLEARWDRFRIDQVVMNLLTNAMRYGNHQPVFVRLESRDGRILLSVRDQGLGIAKESQERIFNRFERAISANDVSGLGLGLFISRQIVEAHRGRIWVESEGLGRGSTFFVDLPAFPEVQSG